MTKSIKSDPVLDLCRRWQDLWANCITSDEDKAGNERWQAEISALEDRLAETSPTTIEGAAAMVDVIIASNDTCVLERAILVNASRTFHALARPA